MPNGIKDGYAVPSPLVITSRLMAGYRIDGVGTLHILPVRRDDEGRVVYAWAIDDSLGKQLAEAEDLSSGVGEDVDLLKTMDTFLSFLGAAADAYHSGDPDGENWGLFPPAVMEWAHTYSEELSMAQFELTYDGSED